MLFPDYERTVYSKNPIAEVICQLRFPQIVRITTDLPSGFQDKIRAIYPEFERKSNVNIALPPDLLKELSVPVLEFLSKSASENSYEFSTSDGEWVISLTSGFMALTAKRYTDWEDFLEHLELPLTALLGEYNITYFKRIGLRYRNVIRRSDWGLTDIPWTDILNPHVLGVVADQVVGLSVNETLSSSVVTLEDGRSKVRIQHGLIQRIVDGITEEELSYLVDNDFFLDEQTEARDGIYILKEFHRQSGRVFNWCITNAFRDAMAGNY